MKTSPQLLNDRGVALSSRGRYADALASYDQAIAIDPHFAQALNNRGTALAMLGRSAESLESFDRAIAARPDYVSALLNRGLALHTLGRYGDALASYDRALEIKKDSFEGLLNRGITLVALDRVADGLASYDLALALQPGDPDVLLSRASALVHLNRIDEAGACYQQILARDPDHAEANLMLCMTQLPTLYLHEREIPRRRAAYATHLKALAAKYERGNLRDLATALGNRQPFFLPYQGQDDRELQSIYGSLACRAMAARFPPATLPGPPARDEPVRVGIVSGYFREHSNWKIPIKGWMSRIDRRRFRMYCYHTGSRRDAETEVAVSLCDGFIQGPLSLERWRELILADAPHVLIYPEVGMNSVAAQLAMQRLAPVQCNSWGHPVTSGFPTLDYFLTSDLMEPAGAQDYYTERLIRLPNLSISYEPQPANPIRVSRSELGLGSDSTVFWCGQALFKYLPQFDEVFVRIAAGVANSQFVFTSHEIGEITEAFRNRIALAFAARGLDAARHCVFLPRMDMQRFAAAIGTSDIILDSIGWSGCNSTLESLPHGLPIVTMPGSFMRGRHTSAILGVMGVTETIAATVDEYVTTAVRLGRDAAWRGAIAARTSESKQRVYSDKACISELEAFLDRVGRNSIGDRPGRFGSEA